MKKQSNKEVKYENIQYISNEFMIFFFEFHMVFNFTIEYLFHIHSHHFKMNNIFTPLLKVLLLSYLLYLLK